MSNELTPAHRAAEKIYDKDYREFKTHGEAREWFQQVIEAEYSKWQPIETAPRDGTPVLLQVKTAEHLPRHCQNFAEAQFVAQYRADGLHWRFAAPVGMGGLPDSWFVGWMPLPQNCI